MPIYEFKCERCGRTFDEVRRVEDRDRPHLHMCRAPGERTRTRRARRKMSLIARTPGRWGGADTAGYSKAVGHYDSFRDLDRKAAERGLVSLDDMPQGTLEQHLHEVQTGVAPDLGAGLPPIRDTLLEAADEIRASGQQPMLDGVPVTSASDIQ